MSSRASTSGTRMVSSTFVAIVRQRAVHVFTEVVVVVVVTWDIWHVVGGTKGLF